MIVTALARLGAGFRKPCMNVLFVCENCSLALMAESILATLGGGRFRAHSAGYAAACKPNGAVMEFLASHHMRVDGLRPQSLERLRRGDPPPMDFVITLADVGHELFADWPGSPFVAHWNVIDGGDDLRDEATLRDVFWTLMRRIKIFVSLPQGALTRRVLERRAVTLQASYL
jgi:arsenate reductase